MKALTLLQLREAVHTIKTSDNFRGVDTESLEAAERFMTQPREFLTETVGALPRDPREILTQIGYKW